MIGGRRAVFLDRDGVINSMWLVPEHGYVDSPANPEQFSLLPGVGEAVRRIRRMGYLAVVVSNQPGIAKGKFTRGVLDQITDKMETELARSEAELDRVYYCLHHPEGVVEEYRVKCDCRKPAPGLLLRAADDLGIDLSRSYMIGDGYTDIQAGRRAGCRTVWIGAWKCDICEVSRRENSTPDFIAGSLTGAAAIIENQE